MGATKQNGFFLILLVLLTANLISCGKRSSSQEKQEEFVFVDPQTLKFTQDLSQHFESAKLICELRVQRGMRLSLISKPNDRFEIDLLQMRKFPESADMKGFLNAHNFSAKISFSNFRIKKQMPLVDGEIHYRWRSIYLLGPDAAGENRIQFQLASEQRTPYLQETRGDNRNDRFAGRNDNSMNGRRFHHSIMCFYSLVRHPLQRPMK